jgi:UDP:flavonoid glycosyltransferase YjiC (YdhE family)
MHYIGALVRSTSSNEVLPAPLNQRDGKPVIYVTLGGGAGSVGNYRFLQILNEGLGDASWNVIVSVGRRLVLDRLPPAPRNMYYYQWVPGGAVIPQSDLVIFHGGHVTMMEVVRAGIPSIVLPFHSEQEGNGRRLEACAAGRVLCPTGAPDSMRLMRGKWAYGEWATWVQPTSALTPEMLRECVLNVLTDARYRAAAKALSAIAAQYGGAATAVELIQQLCETKNGIKSGDG